MNFEIGDETTFRSPNGVVGNPDLLLAAGRSMVRRMKDELWGYFGISATNGEGSSWIRGPYLTLNGAPGDWASWRQAFNVAQNQVAMPNRGAWEGARAKLLTNLGTQTVWLATRGYSNTDPVLCGSDTLGDFHPQARPNRRILMNPFT